MREIIFRPKRAEMREATMRETHARCVRLGGSDLLTYLLTV